METSSSCEKGYDGSRLKVSMATLALFLNEPTCFTLTASTVRFLNWQAELGLQFRKLIGQLLFLQGMCCLSRMILFVMVMAI